MRLSSKSRGWKGFVSLMAGSLVILLMVYAGTCGDLRVDPDGPQSGSNGPKGTGFLADFQSPVRLTRGSGKSVYVSDFLADAVYEIQVDGISVHLIKAISTDGGPTGVAYVDGVVLVGDTETGSVSGYETTRGVKVFTLGSSGDFSDPVDIAVDTAKNLAFVLDGREKTIKVFDLDTQQYLRSISSEGLSAEFLQNPTGLAVDPSRTEVIVSDYGSLKEGNEPAAIKIFSYDGAFIESISGKLGMLGRRFSRIQGLTIDGDGNILIADALAGEILVIDRSTKSIVETLGSFGGGIGELWLPLDVVIGKDGSVITTNNRSRRLEVLDRSSSKAYPRPEDSGSGGFDAAKVSALIPEHSCSFCHDIHGGSNDQLLNNANKEALCMTCHGPGGPSVLKVEVHVYDNSTCADCHVSHSNVANSQGGTNIKLVNDQVFAEGVWRPAVFESRGTSVGDPRLHSFCDGDEDNNSIWDGVCDTCHTNIGRHNYDETNSHGHQQGKTCTTCHTHSNRFKKK